MKWIVLTIIVSITGYTFLTLHYRKPTKPKEPYQDAKNRFTNARLKDAGFTKIDASISRPAEPQRTRATLGNDLAATSSCPPGLPADLDETLVDKPTLPESVSSIVAPRTVSALMSYSLQYTCILPDNKGLLGETSVYIKGNQVALVTDFDRITGGLLARTQDSIVFLTIPAGSLKTGQTYEFTLIAKKQSATWSVNVH